MEALNRLQRQLATMVDAPGVRQTASSLVGAILGRPVRVLQPEADGSWPPEPGVSPDTEALFTWAFEHGQKAGRGTSTLGNHRFSVWPLSGSRGVLGLLVVDPPQNDALVRRDEAELIESLAASLASALERVDLFTESQRQALTVEAERTRNALLHSLSHDLRTPLAVIGGSAETLEASLKGQLDDQQATLLTTVGNEARWLGRQVENLLHLSRLTERGVPWTLAWVPAEDPALSAVGHFRTLHPETEVLLKVDESLPLVRMEPGLMEQALTNLLENARDYAGTGLEVHVTAGATVDYRVLDRGPGVADAEKEAIFDKFARGGQAQHSGARGSGLGLAIVREVAQVHGGSTGVADRPGGGAEFFLRIPLPGDPPPAPWEEP
jgi:two-component system sensor histidine kinase KdpD